MHLTDAEQDLVDKITRRDEGTPLDAVLAIGRPQERRGEAPVHKTAVHLCLKGSTHRRGEKERRGRPRVLKTADVKRLDSARRGLISDADSEWRVTHADVAHEAGYDDHAGATLSSSLSSSSSSPSVSPPLCLPLLLLDLPFLC